MLSLNEVRACSNVLQEVKRALPDFQATFIDPGYQVTVIMLTLKGIFETPLVRKYLIYQLRFMAFDIEGF